MKRKIFSIAEALAVLLMTGLVLAGYPPGPGPTPEELAAELEADLNNMKGRAREAWGARRRAAPR
jgi:hypothetical protein